MGDSQILRVTESTPSIEINLLERNFMKKSSLSLVALAAATLFSLSATAQTTPLQSDRSSSFDFNAFYGNKMPMEMMVTKEQYMAEMERRWMMAETMQGANGKKGMVAVSTLRKAMEQPNLTTGGGAQ